MHENVLSDKYFEKRKMIALTNKQYEGYLNQINCNISKEGSNINTVTLKIIVNLKTIVVILISTAVLHIACVIQNIVYLMKFLSLFTLD